MIINKLNASLCNRCGYTVHLCCGKEPFYHRKLYLVVRPAFPEVNFGAYQIYMDTSKRSNEVPMTFSVECFDAQSTRVNHDAPFDGRSFFAASSRAK